MNTQNLYQIKETYYFRTHIPVDLRTWFDDKEDFKRSLKTKSLTQARRLLRVWNYRTEEVFTLIRTGILTTDQIKVLANNYKRKALADLEQDRSSIELDHIEHEVHLGLLEEHEAASKGALAYNDLKSVTGITKELIEDNGLGEVNNDEFTAIARELLKRNIEIYQIEQQRMQGNYQNGYDNVITGTQSLPVMNNLPESPKTIESPKLSDMIDKFMEDQHRKASANKNTLREYAASCQLFLRIIEDIPVRDITRDTLRTFFDTLSKLPPHISKKAIFRDKTIPEILKMNISETISIVTIEKNILPVKMLFSWMIQEGVLDKNHADVLKPPKRIVSPDEERKAFSIDDLQKLMVGLKQAGDSGNFKNRPERYWITMLGLLQGMRLNEICQLQTGDVVQEKGIWCIKVQETGEDDKTIKNFASHRTVPVHKTLIDLGFIEYLQKCKDSGQPRLWMSLTLDRRGKWSKNYANWFLGTSNTVGFLRTHVTTDSKKNYHSFRHTFVNTLKQADIEEVKIAELVGHKNESETMSRYGKAYSVELMKATIDKLKYEGVDFTS